MSLPIIHPIETVLLHVSRESRATETSDADTKLLEDIYDASIRSITGHSLPVEIYKRIEERLGL